ncbi:MAG: hypothetical protein ACKVZH_07015 [Blastocatellia bacterium]
MYYVAAWAKKSPNVSYTNGGHGMPTSTVEEVKDYHQRILDCYNKHLKGDLKKKTEEVRSGIRGNLILNSYSMRHL